MCSTIVLTVGSIRHPFYSVKADSFTHVPSPRGVVELSAINGGDGEHDEEEAHVTVDVGHRRVLVRDLPPKQKENKERAQEKQIYKIGGGNSPPPPKNGWLERKGGTFVLLRAHYSTRTKAAAFIAVWITEACILTIQNISNIVMNI